MAVYSWSIEVELAGVGAGWTDVSSDVDMSEPVSLSYGTDAIDPENLVAGPGALTWRMANGATETRPLGYYSPGHSACRAGWSWDIRVRITWTKDSAVVTRWLGYLDDIRPLPGLYGDRAVQCHASDIMQSIEDAAPDVPIQVSQTEDTIIGAILDACPIAPANRDLDAGLDTLPYALDREATSLLALLQDVALSVRGYVYSRRDATDGQTLVYESRSVRQGIVSPSMIVTDTTGLVDLVVADRSMAFDRARLTSHPRIVVPIGDMAGPVAVESAVPDTPIAPGETEEIWLDYTDPVQRDTRISADHCECDAGDDIAFNSAADGSGTDLTSYVSVALSYFGQTVKISCENTHPTLPAYRTLCQVRGDGIYSLADVSVEGYVGAGTRTRALDMPYQSDVRVAQGIADSLASLYAVPTALVESIVVSAHRSDEMMDAVLETDIGHAVDVVETVTGIARRFFVNGISWSIPQSFGSRPRLTATYRLAPAIAGAWVLGTGELGSTSRLGS